MPIKTLERLQGNSAWAIWKISEELPALEEALSLSTEDQAILQGISHPQKKKEWLAGRLCIKALAEEMGINYICLKKDEFGKPYLKNEEAEVSISNSYPHVAAIISQQHPVGIDLEQPKEKLRRIAHKFLNTAEREHAQDDLHKLCLYWCAKEALYKIYAKKKISFKENMELEPFEVHSAGKVIGKIKLDQQQTSYPLQYYLNEDFLVVFNT